MHLKLKNFVQEFLSNNSFQGELLIEKGYPFLQNEEQLTNECAQYAKDYLGIDKVEDMDIRMTAEDFSFYSKKIPACLFRLGVRNESKGIIHGVHHPNFDIDNKALEIGAGTMAYLAIKLLD
jgi:metal-dependent amidase/aminoacylase/carboxypeptidase family protein